MAKRKVRRQAKTVVMSKDASGSDVNDAGRETTNTPTQPGRRKYLRGRRGSLRDMPTMPLDILFEIFCYLNPVDLLHLARTNKDFRAVLMSKTSAPFWKAARRNIENFPDLPPYLSEPAFANLVFCSFCHNCLQVNIKTVLWELRARYCSTCLEKMTKPYSYACIPGVKPSDMYNILNCSLAGGERRGLRVLTKEANALLNTMRQIKPDSQQIGEFLAGQISRVAEIRKHSDLCQEWLEDRKDSRADEIKDIREKRLADVIAKLRKVGWGEELDHMANACPYFKPFMELRLMKQPKPLSERAWKTLRPTLEQILEARKVGRLKREDYPRWERRFMLLRGFCEQLGPTLGIICPGVRDIASFPEVRAILDVPDDTEVDSSSFTPLIPVFPDLVARWHSNIKTKLVEITRKAVQLPDEIDPTTLVVGSFFECNICGSFEKLPEVAIHSCREFNVFKLDGGMGDYEDKATQHLQRFPWTCDSLFLPFDTIKEVIVACGQDPYTVTPTDMDKLKIRLSCTTTGCYKPGILGVMTWRAALQHLYDPFVHLFSPKCGSNVGPPGCWKVVSESDRIKASELEEVANAKAQARYEWHDGFACKKCPAYYKPSSFKPESLVISHLLEMHNVENPSEDDIFHHRANPTPGQTVVYLISNELQKDCLENSIQSQLDDGTAAFHDIS